MMRDLRAVSSQVDVCSKGSHVTNLTYWLWGLFLNLNFWTTNPLNMKVFLAEVHWSITAYNLHCWCSFPIPTFLSLLPEQSPSKWYWKLVPVSDLLLRQLSSTKSWLFKFLGIVCFHLQCCLGILYKNQQTLCISFPVIRLYFHNMISAYCTAYSIITLQHFKIVSTVQEWGIWSSSKKLGD